MAKKAKVRKSGKPAKKSVKQAKQEKKKTLMERPITLTIASLLFVLSALINIFVFVSILFLSEAATQQPLAGSTQMFAVIAGVLGVMDAVAAYGLWNMKLYGGIVGAVDLTASILLGFYPTPNLDLVSWLLLSANVILLGLVVVNWKNLK